MAFRDTYRNQVALLVRILPLVAEESCFALKGGTAINLFVRDMPRLSVDIDLTYVPVAPRAESLAAINAAMKRIVVRVQKAIPDAKITESILEGAITRLTVRQGGVQTKIEVTPVLRGCVYEPQALAVSDSVESAFGFAEMPVVSFADLYAGKIVAALDRQHPRDLFDVRDLLPTRGLTTPCARHSSSTCSATIARCRKFSPRPERISRGVPPRLRRHDGRASLARRTDCRPRGSYRRDRGQDAGLPSKISCVLRARRTRLGAPRRSRSRRTASCQMATTESRQVAERSAPNLLKPLKGFFLSSPK